LVTGAQKSSVDRLEREFGILKDVEGFRVGKLETVSLEELEGELGFVD
jgi:RHH-type rel operon transcriptional repressor/antitoxin RelB